MSSGLLKKFEIYFEDALESAVFTADTSAMEVYWDPAGYSRPSRTAKKPPHKKCSGFAGCHLTASAQR